MTSLSSSVSKATTIENFFKENALDYSDVNFGPSLIQLNDEQLDTLYNFCTHKLTDYEVKDEERMRRLNGSTAIRTDGELDVYYINRLNDFISTKGFYEPLAKYVNYRLKNRHGYISFFTLQALYYGNKMWYEYFVTKLLNVEDLLNIKFVHESNDYFETSDTDENFYYDDLFVINDLVLYAVASLGSEENYKSITSIKIALDYSLKNNIEEYDDTYNLIREADLMVTRAISIILKYFELSEDHQAKLLVDFFETPDVQNIKLIFPDLVLISRRHKHMWSFISKLEFINTGGDKYGGRGELTDKMKKYVKPGRNIYAGYSKIYECLNNEITNGNKILYIELYDHDIEFIQWILDFELKYVTKEPHYEVGTHINIIYEMFSGNFTKQGLIDLYNIVVAPIREHSTKADIIAEQMYNVFRSKLRVADGIPGKTPSMIIKAILKATGIYEDVMNSKNPRKLSPLQ